MRGERDVWNLFACDELLEVCGVFVAENAKLLCEALCMVEIAGFESKPHDCEECGGRGRGGCAKPEPVADGELADFEAEAPNGCSVELHVPNFVVADADEATFERKWRVRKCENSPAHQFGGLKFVVPERVKERGAFFRIAQGAAAWRFDFLGGDAQLEWSSRVGKADRCVSLENECGCRTGSNFVSELGAVDVVVRPTLQAVCRRRFYGGRVRRRLVRWGV